MAGHQGTPARWEIQDDQLLQACRVWDLRARRYRHPGSRQEGEFYYIDSRDWAVVVARTVGGEIILVRQFRWGVDDLSWELPGGIVDAAFDMADPSPQSCRILQGSLDIPGLSI